MRSSSRSDELVELRRELHRTAERSNEEEGTASRIAGFLADGADEIVRGLGGHGVAAVYRGGEEGPRVLVRAELDALPIPESFASDHASARPGVSHKCGHDGHMTIVAGVGRRLTASKPRRGSVVLLFQPAEETGEGARRVLDDPAFAALRPDLAFALHNLPGFPVGRVVLREGVFAVASTGLVCRFHGATSHAAEPEAGKSPALALAHSIEAITALPQGTAPMTSAAKATVVHASLGEIAFGTTPGEAEMRATLRADSEGTLRRMSEKAERVLRGLGAAHDLGVDVEWTEAFPVTVNDEAAVRAVEEAARSLGLDVEHRGAPFPWSEDFGHFTAAAPGALFGLGAGADQPALHHPDYDFPDALVETGVALFEALARNGTDGAAEGGRG